MLLRASILGVVLLGGCASAFGKLQVDTPALPYVPPDIDELTGIENSDEAAAAKPAAAAEPAPAPAPAPAPKGTPPAAPTPPKK